MPEFFEHYIQSWDTAIKLSENSDYSVCTIWGYMNSTYYLVDLVRKRMAYPELKNTAERLNNKYCPKVILIEDKASGQSLIQDLRSDGIANIVAQKPKIDKITRFASVVPLFQSGSVLLPKEKSWMRRLLNEMTAFPYSKHDDIVDSMSQFLGYIKYSKKELKLRLL